MVETPKHSLTRQEIASIAARQYSRGLHRYFLRCLGDIQQAKDLEQEVYLRLLRVKNDDLIHDVAGYVFRIAANVVWEFRSRKRRESALFDSSSMDALAHEITSAWQDREVEKLTSKKQIDRLLGLLQPCDRVTLLLRKRDGLSQAEVAKQLNISVFTVKKYMLRAVATLRAAKWTLDEQNGE